MRLIALSRLIVPALLGIALSGCASIFPSVGGTLRLREHQLAGAPELDSLRFQPLQGTQDEVLAEHTSERSMEVSREVIMVEGSPAIASLGESRDLLAILFTAKDGRPEQTVRLLRDDKTIFETPAGLPSPVFPIQGLWTYNESWALEILVADQSAWAGQIFIDGELLNELKGYDEAFGLQLLAGKPFFFYLRNSRAGFSYDSQETNLDYDEVLHYRCCGESVLNPLQAQNMVAFFAVREKIWFYVELGVFDG